MKKVVVGLLLMVGLFFLISPTVVSDDYVYICDSGGSKKYHLTEHCRGLSNCKSKIIRLTKAQAYSKGKKELCGWEDK
ncbi:MAG: hypothetical protein MI810_16985 [Flavobacteriales bacterium]|nr:hypothetical protein [Flavobacteriales bacterium]